MTATTRRHFLAGSLTALVTGSAGARFAQGNATANGLDLPRLGRLRPSAAAEIDASPLSVGFETLDRRMFEPQRTYDHLAALGVKWARCQTGWARTETTPGRYDFAWLDEVVDSLLNIGVAPWFNLGYGNQLYTPEAPDASAVGWAPVFDEKAQEGWLHYTQAIADHFRDRVTHWEIWNEPNHRGFWRPRDPSAEDYVRLVARTVPAIRQRVPRAVIIGGALAGMPTPYLAACLKAGLADYVDGISFHPYRPVPERDYEPTVAAWRELLAKYKPDMLLWQGENGCPSKGGEGSAGALRQYDWTETRQAKWALRRLLTDLRVGLDLTSYFHLVDLVAYNWGQGPSGQTNYKGLLRGTDYTPKPAYFAYQNLCALFDAQTELTDATAEVFDVALPERRIPFLRRGQFVRNGGILVAYWFPEDLLTDWEPTRLSLRVPATETAQLSDPVLIDTLDGSVYRVEPAESREATRVFERLPLMDYPLVLAERSVVELAEA